MRDSPPGPFKATSERGHRHQLVTGAGRGGSCVPVSLCWSGPGTEPITSTPAVPLACEGRDEAKFVPHPSPDRPQGGIFRAERVACATLAKGSTARVRIFLWEHFRAKTG